MKYFLSICCAILLMECSTTSMVHVAPITDTSYVYWTSSQRVMLFNTYAGSIRLRSLDSTNIVRFDKSVNGLVFYKRQSDENDVDGICGKVLSHDNIESITDTITIQIWCNNIPNPFNVGNASYPYLPSPVTVDVLVCKVDDIEKFNEQECLSDN